jgi:K+-transporting ATPase KdpF subunit
MRKGTTLQWMGAAIGVALMIVLAVALLAPEHRLSLALRATARWSFLLFWLASVGGALATLFGSRFSGLAARARDFGLSFASAHLVHLGLVAWLYYAFVGPGKFTLIFFGVAAFWTYLLALLSVSRITAALPSRTWKVLRTIGVEYISIAFLYDFARNPFGGGFSRIVEYLPFLFLAVTGPLLRAGAWVKKLQAQRLTT